MLAPITAVATALATLALMAAACAPAAQPAPTQVPARTPAPATQAAAVQGVSATPAATAGTSNAPASPTTAPTATTPPSPTAAAPAGADLGPTPASGEASVQVVQVDLAEFTITFDTSTFKAGPVQFKVTNTGKLPHALEIKGQGLDEKTAILAPGQSAALNVKLTPGTYEVWCPVDAHKDRGMDTTITVQ